MKRGTARERRARRFGLSISYKGARSVKIIRTRGEAEQNYSRAVKEAREGTEVSLYDLSLDTVLATATV